MYETSCRFVAGVLLSEPGCTVQDPYVVNGLVPSYDIKEWTVLLK
jgi:hypothetical protein